MNQELKDWCAKKHEETNHYYDGYIPYKFHLEIAEIVYETYKHLLPEDMRENCLRGVWSHDLIEDVRQSYNDVLKMLGFEAAEIAFACTNEKGRTRPERANAKYYKSIITTPGAVFVKLCDRIANLRYSRMKNSRQFKTYQKENEHFMASLGWAGFHGTPHVFAPMFSEIIVLVK